MAAYTLSQLLSLITPDCFPAAANDPQKTSLVNEVRERFFCGFQEPGLKACVWKGLTRRVALTSFPYLQGGNIVTLPWDLERIDAVGVAGGLTAQVRLLNQWYEFNPNGAGIENLYAQNGVFQGDGYSGNGLQDLGAGFVSYLDPPTSGTSLTLTTEAVEVANPFVIRGVDPNGNPLSISPNLPLTASTISLPGNWAAVTQVTKPITNGRLFVQMGSPATQISIYQAQEQTISWRRYLVRGQANTPNVPPVTYIAICKLCYQPVSGNNSLVTPSLIGAYKNGLKAVAHENANDHANAQADWQRAFALLNGELTEFQGPGETGSVRWQMAAFAGAGIGNAT